VVNRAVLLDSGPLGLASNPNLCGLADACNLWVRRLVDVGVRVVPEVRNQRGEINGNQRGRI
jgi:hypothetical protein